MGTNKNRPPKKKSVLMVLILFLHDFVLVIELKVMTARHALREEFFHFILVEVDAAIITEFLVGDVVRAHFAVIRHHFLPYLL